ncbi:MAG: FAD-dependent oxidoreductase [Fidelibacterota bacterium]
MTLPEERLETRFREEKPRYTESEARIEANRCLYCYDAPCTEACPTGIDIPGFIRKIVSGNIRGAAKTIFEVNALGVSTARVCPVEELCVGACVYNQMNSQPVQIGRLQRYATESALEKERADGRKLITVRKAADCKVALIGAGPASLSCAAILAREGVSAVLYEKNSLPGGLNLTGIAPYKMTAASALWEIEWLLQSGFEIRTGTEVGRDIAIDNLLADFDALFLGIGLGRDKRPGIPGENAPGVWGATDLIRRIKNDPGFALPENLETALVIGGGNSAIDIARELAVLGVPEVNIVYRRTVAEMPGYLHELNAARQAGVRMIEQAVPVEIDPGSPLTLRTKNKTTGALREMTGDWIVLAIGNERNAGDLIPGLELDAKGCVVVDPDTMRTSMPRVYAGGDCVNGGKEVVNAVAHGRDAAWAMLKEWGLGDLYGERKNHG